jgi:signal transduction histidine kinase/DNA-binding response OmpR family regulator/ligand-binding sensor domain-containing protein
MFNLEKILLTVFFLFPNIVEDSGLNAQKAGLQPSFRFEAFELPGGELGNHVQTIAQDSFGFMWFGSQFGLHRWDGYQLKTYYADPEDSTAIISNYVEYIYVATDGTLWLGHWGYGLDRFDYETETFHHYVHDPDDPTSLGGNYVSEIMEDLDGNIWLGTHHGVYRLDVKTGKFKQFLHDPNAPHSLSYNKCRTMLMDAAGTLWFGTGYSWEYEIEGGLNRYRPETEDFVRYLHDPDDPNSLSNNKVSEIFEDSEGNFWVGTIGDGLHLMDRSTGKFQRLQRNPTTPNGLSGPFSDDTYDMHIRFVFEDQNQKIWIGAWDGGITYFDPETGYIQSYFYDENDPKSLTEKFPWTMCQSSDGTLWGCTAGPNGTLFNLKESIFNYYPATREGNSVNSFCESKDQKIWVGTEKSGLLQFNPKTKEQIPFDSKSLGPVTSNLSIKDLGQIDLDKNNLLNRISKIVEDKDGRLWLKKWEVGLLSMHPGTGELKIYKHDLKDENSIGEGGVTDIFRDEKDRIWILTTMGDLNLYEPERDHFIRYKYADPERGFYYHSVMAPASDGNLWIAGSGLNFAHLPLILTKFDPETTEFEYADADIIADDPAVKYERIYKVEEDNAGNVWIVSETRVKRINPKTGGSMHLGAFHFGSLFFRGMAMDEHQRVWLFGDKISLFDPDSGIKSTFEAIYDIKSLTHYAQSVYKHSNDIIYIGGKGGFQTIDPNKIGGDRFSSPPETVINDFQILYRADENKEQKNLTVNILTANNIHLSHDQNAFSFRFAALDFHDPKSNRHEFKLEGYDEQWRLAGSEPVANYIKVPPGNYTFKVRGATLRSEWGPEKAILIHISAPWWATWWAYTIYTLLVLGLLYAFYYFQVNRKLDQAEAQRLKELDMVKTRLYTNITHEFRTPLTVIMGMTNNIRGHLQEKQLIQRNSKNLLRLINQLLDLSKLDSGILEMDIIQANIVNYLQYLTESFYSMADEKQIRLTFYPEVKELIMDYDEAKIQHIVYNLLSNAIKFTPKGGKVILHLRQVEQNNQPCLQMKVSDTGIGISEADRKHIFDRFYQGDASPTRKEAGTGVGLALTKELVNMMGGNIAVESEVGTGTDFLILLPVKREAAVKKKAIDSKGLEPVHEDAPAASSSFEKPAPFLESATANKGPDTPSLLIIEDNQDVVTYIESLLQKDYQIDIARNGQEGIDKALELIPDIIISDVMMPEKDGFEVCQTLKNDERSSHIPIILLTAKAATEDRIEGLQGGADAYLTKPFNKQELFVRLEKLLELRKALQARYSSMESLLKKRAPQAESSMDDVFLKKLVDVVLDRLDDLDLGVVDLCRAAHLSNSHVNRKLKALTGKTPSQFIRSIRLQKAMELLQTTDLNISEIAYDVGFSNPNYFSRSFSEEFGFPPNVIRK